MNLVDNDYVSEGSTSVFGIIKHAIADTMSAEHLRQRVDELEVRLEDANARNAELGHTLTVVRGELARARAAPADVVGSEAKKP